MMSMLESNKRPGRKRAEKFYELRRKIRALKPTHSYRQIAQLLQISPQLACYYAKPDPAERQRICRCCSQPIKSKP